MIVGHIADGNVNAEGGGVTRQSIKIASECCDRRFGISENEKTVRKARCTTKCRFGRAPKPDREILRRGRGDKAARSMRCQEPEKSTRGLPQSCRSSSICSSSLWTSVCELFAETKIFHWIPTYPHAEPKASPRKPIWPLRRPARPARAVCRWGKMTTPVVSSIVFVKAAKKPNKTNGS